MSLYETYLSKSKEYLINKIFNSWERNKSLQHQLEIQTKRVENLKKSNDYYVGKKARVVLEPVPRIQTSVHDVVTIYIEQDETWLIGGWAEQAKVIDQELEKQLEEKC